MKIVNDVFETGKQYIGRINGVLLEVAYQKRIPTRFKDIPGTWERLQEPCAFADVIGFKDCETGKIYETNIDNAKRLLLDKIG